MQYSTKKVIRQYPVYKNYSNVYNISSLFITCTRANVKHMATLETFRCIPCACVQDIYTLKNGSIKIVSRNCKTKSMNSRMKAHISLALIALLVVIVQIISRAKAISMGTRQVKKK